MCEEVTENYESVYETNNVNLALVEREDTTDVLAERQDTTDVCHHD